MSRVDRRVVIAALVLLVGIAQGALAGVAHHARRRADQELDAAKGQLATLQTRIEVARIHPALGEAAGESKWRLAAEPDVSRTLQQLQGIGDAVGVQLAKLEVLKSKDEAKRSFRIAGEAEPGRVCALVAAIEDLEEVVVIEAGRVLPVDGERIAFDLGLATYHLGPGGDR